MKTYRVFLTRTFIAVEWYDVIAESSRNARTLACKAANLEPNPRLTATDNGWIPDEPLIVASCGSCSGGAHEMKPVLFDDKGEPIAFKCAD